MVSKYIAAVRDNYVGKIDYTELTFRTPLENLLNAIEQEITKRKLRVVQEARQTSDKGRPDFKILDKNELCIGYVETKNIGEDLDIVFLTDQISRYCRLSDNLILTNYSRFMLIRSGKAIIDVDLRIGNGMAVNDKAVKLTQLIKIFFEHSPSPITSIKELALKLADRAKCLKEYAELELADAKKTKIDGLYNVFKKSLIPELSSSGFADIYSQTITYSLFLAFLNCDSPASLSMTSAFNYIPANFNLIKELFHEVELFPESIKWVIEEIINILKSTNVQKIREEFEFTHFKKKGFIDPFVYFYEDFMDAYDKSEKNKRGVFYTPVQVVSFIVRSAEKILKNTLGKSDGYTGENITVLDFACGTGTFLVYVFEQAIKHLESMGCDTALIKKLVNDRLINQSYGFEILVAPYVIAHLKLWEYLKEKKCHVEDDKQLKIYLTNTLSNSDLPTMDLLPQLSEEGKTANRVKNDSIMVIIGNPPYSVSSSNKKNFITDEKLSIYKPTDEKKINLDDDYIKFIRFAHWKMEDVESGVVAIITNNSYLDGITHRKMRGELLKSFDSIYLLNLHGNSRIGELTPNGSPDQNVFDIMQGVAISIFVKKSSQPNKDCRLYYYDLLGTREDKYSYLDSADVESVMWLQLDPRKKDDEFNQTNWGKNRFKDNLSFFVPRANSDLDQYAHFWGLKEIFINTNSGIETKNDELTIQLKKEDIKRIIEDFKNTTDKEVLGERYKNKTSDGTWSVQNARANLNNTNFDDSNIRQISYRPFDNRWTYYTNQSNGFLGRPRYDTMKHFVLGDNYGLSFPRQIVETSWQHALITNHITESCLVSMKTREKTHTAPLYLYEYEMGNPDAVRKTNFTKPFMEYLSKQYNQVFVDEKEHATSIYSYKSILGYIYAILYSRTYRRKYLDLLRIDFPRVPFSSDVEEFLRISDIGMRLIDLHTGKITIKPTAVQWAGTGNCNSIEKIKYYNGNIWINKQRCIGSVGESIWEHKVGSHRVLEQWLKGRGKRCHEITAGDAYEFIKIVGILEETETLMNSIDNLTSSWI